MTTSTRQSVELVVVTGASTGIGLATAAQLAARGFYVLAGVRRAEDAERIRAERIEPVMLDITVAADVAALAKRVDADPEQRQLRALVNNAGIAVNAPVETLPMDEWRRQFEVNLFGQVAVTQALLPALLASRGTIVSVSSVGGRIAMATYGAYAGAKFALEAVNDALRRELDDLGVRVVVVEPGAVVTQIATRGVATAERLAADMTPAQHARYDRLIGAITAQAKTFDRDGVPASTAADVILKAVLATRPKARYAVGRQATILLRLSRLLSDRALDRVLRRNLRPHYAAT